MSAVHPHVQAAPISLSDPRHPLSPALLDAPGGFAWWYVDHVDEAGNGLVLIWSFGLPFLPGYLAAARDGRPQPAAGRPSLNVVLYERGEASFYLLQEYAPDQVSWDGDRWQFGSSHFHLTEEGGARHLDVTLSCAIPGSRERLEGHVRVTGPAARFDDAQALPRRSEHEWSPLMGPAHLQADLRIGGTAHRRRGPAYHDRNGGSGPLDGLGILRWTWGRWVGSQGTRIYYVLWPKRAKDPQVAWGVDIDPTGRARLHPKLDVELGPPTWAAYGMLHHRELRLLSEGRPWLDVRTAAVIDDGPFYLRTLVTRPGEDAMGLGEWVAPPRIDRDWQRPFVRMRVHRTHRTNSIWLPLFSGPSEGRLRRLVGLGS